MLLLLVFLAAVSGFSSVVTPLNMLFSVMFVCVCVCELVAKVRSCNLEVFDSTFLCFCSFSFSFFFYSVIVQGFFYVHCYFLNIVFLLVHKDKKRSQVLSFFNYINIKKGIIKNFA